MKLVRTPQEDVNALGGGKKKKKAHDPAKKKKKTEKRRKEKKGNRGFSECRTAANGSSKRGAQKRG